MNTESTEAHLGARIPRTLHRDLRQIASGTERSVSYHVRKALERYVQNEKRNRARRRAA